MPATFLIYRIIGNSLPPRHGPEDTFEHLKLILESEPEFPDCEKRWLLNRIVNPDMLARCRQMIEATGRSCHVIPFDVAAYRKAFLDASGMPKLLNSFASSYRTDAPPVLTNHAKEWVLRHKALAAINLNQARNKAIELGVMEADWVLPLDGWCYFTSEAWQTLTQALTADPDARYGMIPVARLESGMDPRSLVDPPAPDHEPQIAFHHDAPDRFDERLRYGNRDKAELLVRLGLPGEWNDWKPAFWDRVPPLKPLMPDAFVVAGHVYRLAPGASGAVEEHDFGRWMARYEGFRRLSEIIDTALVESAMRGDHSKGHRVLTPRASNRHVQHAKPLREAVEGILLEPLLSAPTGRLQEVDRASLYTTLRAAAILTAGGVLLQDTRCLDRSASLLRTSFIDEATSFKISDRLAASDGDADSSGDPSQCYALRDLWVLPNLCETLLISRAIPRSDYEAVRARAEKIVDYIARSKSGRQAYLATNHTGTWTHLLAASLTCFTGQAKPAATLLNAAPLRLASQYGAIGTQPVQLEEAQPLRNSMLNLTAWVLLAGLCRSWGVDLWAYRGVAGESVCGMLRFMHVNLKEFPEFEGAPARFEAWLDALFAHVPDDGAGREALPRRSPDDRAWRDDPETGLPPHWWLFAPVS